MAPSTSSTSLMALLLMLFPVLHVAAEAPTPLSSAQIILAACKNVGSASTHVDVEFCQEALGSVADAVHSLDYQDLAGLAVGLLIDNATSTEGKIVRLLREGGGGGVRLKEENDAAVARCLQSCQSLYGGIIDGGPPCMSAVNAGKFGAATAILEKAAVAAKECEDGFGKSSSTSLLTPEDKDAYELAKLGAAFLRFA
uniref:Uncharacterized protein n=1 Tax=Avena sativa TaxID=4498 RepID=A0ACD5X632_AVESA